MNGRVQLSSGAFLVLALALPLNGQELSKKGKNADINAIGHRNITKDLNIYSLDQERKLGEQLSKEVEHTSHLLSDPEINSYLDRVTQNLAHNSDSRFPITVHLIQADPPEGFALPGGRIYVDSGLILSVENESQLAGVIANLIARVALRQATRNATKGVLLQIASDPALAFLPYGWAGYGIYEGMNLSVPLELHKLKRQQDLEADYFGLQYLYKAGYDPSPYLEFASKNFEEVYAKQHLSQSLSQFPDPKMRIAAMKEEMIKILPSRSSAIVNTSEFDIARKHLAQLVRSLPNPAPTEPKPTLRRTADAPTSNP